MPFNSVNFRAKTTTTHLKLLLCISSLFCSSTASADEANIGEKLSMTCVACHGKDGVAQIDGYPNLKGQNEQYLVNALKAYRSGQRTGGNAGIMQSQVGILTDEDIQNLAFYYANLK